MQNNKTVVLFLIKFFGTYALLFLLYSYYLEKNQVNEGVFVCAPITKTVANQTQFLLNSLGFNATIEQHTEEISIKVLINNKYVSRVIEGCNAISIIILFSSFIVAFAGKFKPTFLYILFGSLLIYVVNVVRIALISIALYKFPKHQYILHDVIFPTIIYGITFLLWFVWVYKFSKHKK